MGELERLAGQLQRARVALGERKGQQQRLLQDRAQVGHQLEEQRELDQVYEQVILLLQQTSEYARKQAREQIEHLVTRTLQAVFGGEYAFKIELTERAGRPEAEFYVLSRQGDGWLQTRPQEARGGGVVDLVSLGLRIAMLQTYQPRLDGPLLLDEPAKHVSDDFVTPAAQYLEAVSRFFERQVILVTHNAHLADTAPVEYGITLRDEGSVVTRKR